MEREYPAYQVSLFGRGMCDARRLVRQIKKFIYLRTYRTDILGLAAFRARPLFSALGAHFGLDYWEVMALSEDEMDQLPKRVPAKSELQKRIQAFRQVVIGQKIVETIGLKEGREKVVAQEVRGQMAYGGRVRGRARLLYDTSEQDKVKAGDVLIAVMTFPNLVPAMERAAAFVTDEGGILCHAAIISREMKKPCIIGTKIATKVFKDGDLVEVDANRWVVRKL